MMKDKPVNEIIITSKLPGTDYVANPYIGCTHGCIYCYANFIGRINKINADWGTYSICKQFKEFKIAKNYLGKRILISSVTDPYQPTEINKRTTRKLLECLKDKNAKIEILTKSNLVLEDLDIIKSIPGIKVGI